MLKKIIYFILAGLLFMAGRVMLQGDYVPFLIWWAVSLGIGIIFMPLSFLLFPKFHDKGYLFAKTIGFGFTGYLVWLFSSLHIMKFTQTTCLISVFIVLILNSILSIYLVKRKKVIGAEYAPLSFKNHEIDHIIVDELLFFAAFLLFTYIRGFKPEAYGTEKFMDYGFMTSMMRNDFMPPQDFWFSGTKLNYYYAGQYFATFFTKLTSIKVSLSYNLMLMFVGAFTIVLPYSLVYNVMKNFKNKSGKLYSAISTISGLVAGTAVLLAGNMHYPTYVWFEGWFRKFFGIAKSTTKYWFPDATRFIGYHPETHDKTIHEFPAYSFVLGDLHAHVINIMFVVTLLAILFAWMCARREKQNETLPLLQEVFHPSIIAISFFIGLYHVTNYWDFPIYFVVSGGVILFTNLIVYNFKKKAFQVTALQGVSVIVMSELVCLPFTLMFDRISTTPMLCVAHTPLNQMIILWGLPFFMVIAFLCFTIANYQRKKSKEKENEEESEWPAVFTYMKKLPISDLFIIVLGLCAIGLVLIPEIIYIQDIYSGDYKRANTMFKLTYQAFIMFGLCFGYIFVRLIAFRETRRQIKVAIVGLVLFAMSVCYIQNAVHSWYGNIFDQKGYKGLDCTAFMKTNSAFTDDVGAIDWLNKHVKGIQVVLEANGDSYTDYERVSVMTGLPTILGWKTHEWLWKSDPTLLDKRAADIETIYTSTDKEQVVSLLKKYNVSYIYVGHLEQEKFPSLYHELLKSLGDVVYMSHSTNEKTYETYIVKIK